MGTQAPVKALGRFAIPVAFFADILFFAVPHSPAPLAYPDFPAPPNA
jgi:hypothetical protein